MIIWLIVAPCEGGGWVLQAEFTTRQLALEYAATVPHEVFMLSRELDECLTWEQSGAKRLTGVLLAELHELEMMRVPRGRERAN